jgi:SAM-dependent methyltransferase
VSLRSHLDGLYPDYGEEWPSRAYRDAVLRYATPSSSLLDFGAGRGKVALHGFKDVVKHSAGVDVDSAVFENMQVDETKVLGADGRIPFDDESFDVVVSAYVLEHVPEPTKVFSEVARVLRPGGAFVFLTPNRRHYVPTIARVTPHWFHVWINERRGHQERDTFPTVYRSNTPGSVARLASAAGLTVDRMDLVEGRPEYLRSFGPLYPIGVMYERAVNAIPALAGWRVVMVGALVKPNR